MSARTLELRVMRLTGNDENGEEMWSEPEVLESGTDYDALSRRLKELSDEAKAEGRGYAVIYWITPKPPEKKPLTAGMTYTEDGDGKVYVTEINLKNEVVNEE